MFDNMMSYPRHLYVVEYATGVTASVESNQSCNARLASAA